MKTKSLFYILIICLVLLVYSLFCYSFINTFIRNKTNNIISDYISTTYLDNTKEYEYITSLTDSEGNINVYIKTSHDKSYKQDYYHFIFNNNYELLDIDKVIPSYIRY